MDKNWSIDELQETWMLVSKLHQGQKYGGKMEGQYVEYINHIGGVTFEILKAIEKEVEFDADLAIKCALLHDTVEDTPIPIQEIRAIFGTEVAAGVLALTKDESLSGIGKMMDSLRRIQQQPREVGAVKMADRIVNLQAPPAYWTNEKRLGYMEEAKIIHRELKSASVYLANRLLQKIEAYNVYITN